MESVVIDKLNEVVNQLMNAYEKLKKENKTLKDTIKALETDKDDLANNSKEQSDKINTMVNKIETVLTSDELNMSNETSSNISSIKEEQKEQELTKETYNNQENEKISNEHVLDSSNNINSSKIDLGRMESLLKGL